MRNQLLTKTIERELEHAAANSGGQAGAVKVVAKYFTPDAQCTWFITEGRKVEADWELFGLCDLGMGSPELGYVMLSELQSVRGQLGLPVERDLYWSGNLQKAASEVGCDWLAAPIQAAA